MGVSMALRKLLRSVASDRLVPERTQHRRLVGLSVFVVLSLTATYVVWSTLQRTVPGSTTAYTAFFDDASGLFGGDDVRIAGVRVGRVEDVSRDGDRARVRIAVGNEQTVTRATKAAIRYQNLIGQRYVSLTPASGVRPVPLAPGAELVQPSEDSFDVTTLLAGFQPVFDTLDADQVNALSEGLLQAFQGDGVSLSRTVSEVGRLAEDMANRDVVIGAVIANLSAVMRDLARQGDDVGVVVDSLGRLIENLNTNSAAFGRATTDLGRTAEGFADVLGRSRQSLSDSAVDASVATRTLIDNGARLDRMAQVMPIFLGSIAKVVGEGSYVKFYACDLDISLGDVLIPPGIITQIGGTKHSVVCR
ncbi:MCE family protein [Gordonia sp. NPDC058843]|uniref:MCE family protein n=1 Tax=Gordonia sp. NPDC058843 TaxID=3346648 RepID=UPI0036AB35E8